MAIATLSIGRVFFLPEIYACYFKKIGSFLLTISFVSINLFLLYLAWINRTDEVWTAEYGWGYGFGVAGGTMMFLLLLYPMRKRLHVMTKFLSVKFWFRLHMVFGVLGPIFILMHTSYRLGSVNGQVAFYSMLIVAISGLFGRYFYTRIHYGLYGKKATFDSLRLDSKELNNKLGLLFSLKPTAKTLLGEYEDQAVKMPEGIISSAIHWIRMRYRAAVLYRSVIRSLNVKLLSAARLKGWDRNRVHRKQRFLRSTLLLHKNTLIQIQELHFYERLFAIWHLLHLPLFIMMLITGAVHIYAVHAY